MTEQPPPLCRLHDPQALAGIRIAAPEYEESHWGPNRPVRLSPYDRNSLTCEARRGRPLTISATGAVSGTSPMRIMAVQSSGPCHS